MNRVGTTTRKGRLHNLDRYIVTDTINDRLGVYLGEEVCQVISVGEYESLATYVKDDAIALAKAILIRYQIPFCNRVP